MIDAYPVLLVIQDGEYLVNGKIAQFLKVHCP